MKRTLIAATVLAGLIVACLLLCKPAHAQDGTTSLFDTKRMSVGLRAYRSFDEVIGTAGSYTSGWWAGPSFAWEITSPKDPNVKIPISLMGAVDLGMPDKRIRGYIGIGFLLKKAGQ